MRNLKEEINQIKRKYNFIVIDSPPSITFDTIQIIKASGGFDHGTATGKNKLQIDLTINPFDIIENGQSYIVLSYGLSNTLDFHSYLSHESTGTNQYYYGLMTQFIKTSLLDLSTAFGLRHRLKRTDRFFPQLLYTIKLNNVNIGGSVVAITDITNNKYSGITIDVALFFPLVILQNRIKLFEKMELGMGFFRNLSGNIYPTYSIDMKFKKIS